MHKIVIASLLILSLGACVPKKKFVQSLQEKNRLEASYLDSIQRLHNRLTTCYDTVSALRLRLAERKGENNILLRLRRELKDRIKALQLEIESLSSQSASSLQQTRKTVAEKEAEINALRDRLRQVDAAIARYKQRVEAFAADVSLEFQNYSDRLLSVTTSEDRAVVTLSANALLFKRAGSASLSDRGKALVAQISKVIRRYPDLEIYVVGHTDNRQPPKAYKDNWNFSAMRAATVVREMTQVNDVNSNQVYVVAKAEFAPVASNETSDGRARNQRIELVARPLTRRLIKDIKAIVHGD